MQTCFNIEDGSIIHSDEKNPDIRIFVSPDEDEKKNILEALNINRYDIEAALDPDEISRIEFTSDNTAIIWKQPSKKIVDERTFFEISSVGLFLQKDKLTMVKGTVASFPEERFEGIKSLNYFVLRYFFLTVRKYLSHLKMMKQVTAEEQSLLSSSMDNKHLLRMFGVSENLVYYRDAIEANGGVLSKLRENAKRLRFSTKEVEFLEDIIHENNQCARQAQIYSEVVSGLMDARGNIINNNMNILLKNLTIINVIFLPLNLIASMGGMSEFSMMIGEYGINWKIAYPLFSIAMVIVGAITWFTLRRYMGNNHKNGIDLK